MELKGSVALVTGANRGLGRAFAKALLEAGAAKVYGAARNPDSLERLQAEADEGIVALKLDVTEAAQVRAAAETANDVTLLINNAGVLEGCGIMEAGHLDPLRREMEVNLFGLTAMSQAFAPVIEANGGGAIVNMLSVASLICFPPFGSYSASKAAAMAVTRCLRYELKPRGIDVHGLYAGFIATDMIDYVEGEKESPENIVAAAMEGVAAGTPDIDCDERAKAIRAALRDDPYGLEASAWERADAFRAAHPLGTGA